MIVGIPSDPRVRSADRTGRSQLDRQYRHKVVAQNDGVKHSSEPNGTNQRKAASVTGLQQRPVRDYREG